MRRLILLLLAVASVGLGLLAHAFAEARADPIVRRASVALPGWPAGAPPIRVVLISDIHVGTLAMGERRLNRIVAQINALAPDLVLIAGDCIYGHDPNGAARFGEAMVAPLSRLRARYGTVAVPGNHDHWTGLTTVRDQLRRAGVAVIENQAILRGPLALGAVGDDFSRHDDLPATLAALRRLPGGRLLLTHSPDIAPDLPADAPVLLAGHTHCAQVVLPLWGPILEVSRYGARYRCGLVREGGRTVVVTAGLGTSALPLRLNAPPDLWLLSVGGQRRRR